MKPRLLLFLLCLALLLPACNPFYVIRAAYEESKILMSREEITDVVAAPSCDATLREKLLLVLQAREFAKSVGLTPEDSFTLYAELDTDVLVWVLMGSRKEAFELKTWWFPIVGSVPYKGFFHKEDAIDAARSLEEDGFETRIRGTDAFSTLGWFNDPILSTTLQREHIDIVNTVLHEILHSTVWIPGHVPFNESAANFFGHNMAIAFFADALEQCRGDETCGDFTSEQLTTWYEQSVKARERSLLLTGVLHDLHADLTELYDGPLSKEEKIKEREVVFAKHQTRFQKEFPRATVLKKINNAEIMQLRVYMTGFDTFEEAFEYCDRKPECFVELLKTVAETDFEDPFDALTVTYSKNAPQ